VQNEIINILPDQENYVIGFADMGDLVKKYYPYRYAVVVGKRLDDAIIDEIEDGPTPVYYELYKSTNDELNLITAKITRFLQQNTIPCVQIKSTVQEEDLPVDFAKTLRMNFSHKMAATRAGLGWIGKTDLLVSERFGPRIRLATVLTDHRFENPGIPITESRCGKCDICVMECPGQAANGKLWKATLDRDEFYNAFKCRDACRKLSLERLDKRISLCGICVSVCPFGKTINRRKKK
jgi:epoxyqueuosine reductase